MNSKHDAQFECDENGSVITRRRDRKRVSGPERQ
jgi:hypothetical protein